MPFRPTHYPNVHDEFYSPAGMSARERRSIRDIGYDLGLRGRRVTREFLDDQAQVYHGRLNSALHTIDQRADVVKRRSGDGFRNISLGLLALGGFAILCLALTVDYKILHDFWTTIYQNKFLQVPESLKDNVMFKSLQVLFAVLAIHFLISAPGVLGKAIRGTFMVAIGVMVIGMLIGLGFLATKSVLPAGSTLLNKPVDTSEAQATVSNDQILAGLGLRPSTAEKGKSTRASSRGNRVADLGDLIGAKQVKGETFWNKVKKLDLASMSTIIFFATFSLIFLFVSSVGALCMHYSLRSFNALFGGISPEHPEHAMPTGVRGLTYWALGKGEWRSRTRKDLSDQRRRIFHAQRLIGDPGYRSGLMERFFAEFAAGYTEGLHRRDSSPRRFAGPDFETLRNEMSAARSEAAADWSVEAIADRLPSEELRQSLGYNPEERSGGRPFGFVRNLVAGQRQFRDGSVIEDQQLTNERDLPSRSSDNVFSLSAEPSARKAESA
ncbi:MAG TPA: hypothetical protein VEH07_09610 [Alphaproteobacteria bacterium]|nr:hypothetical protein [Alphaproteobacteria bacterium]